MKKDYVCMHCKEKHSIYRECFVEWIVEEQEWMPTIINDELFCYYCNKEVSVEEIEIKN